jgi:hypothetical protein
MGLVHNLGTEQTLASPVRHGTGQARSAVMAMRSGPLQLPSLDAGTAARDQQWWDSLVESNSQRVWDIARGRGLDPSEAAELFQLVWLRLADHLGDVATDEQISEWVCAVADHEARLAAARLPAATKRLEGRRASLGLLRA